MRRALCASVPYTPGRAQDGTHALPFDRFENGDANSAETKIVTQYATVLWPATVRRLPFPTSGTCFISKTTHSNDFRKLSPQPLTGPVVKLSACEPPPQSDRTDKSRGLRAENPGPSRLDP